MRNKNYEKDSTNRPVVEPITPIKAQSEEKIKTAPKEEEILKHVVANTLVCYRVNPSKEAEAIGTIAPGTAAEVIEENKEWYRLKDLGWSKKCFYN